MNASAYLEQSPLLQIRLELDRFEPHDDGHDGGRRDQRGVAELQKYAIEVGQVQRGRLSRQRLDRRKAGVSERCGRE